MRNCASGNLEIPGSRPLARPGMTGEVALRKFSFIIFVDATFTNLFERLFTNVFEVTGAKSANYCLCRTGNAD